MYNEKYTVALVPCVALTQDWRSMMTVTPSVTQARTIAYRPTHSTRRAIHDLITSSLLAHEFVPQLLPKNEHAR